MIYGYSFLSLFVYCVILFKETEDRDQCYRAIYKMEYRLDSTVLDNISVSMTELLIYPDESWFRGVQQGRYDSIAHHGLQAMQKFTGEKFPYHIHKNRREGKLTYYDQIRILVSDQYYYEEQIADQQWTVISDTLRIGDMLCQGAELSYGKRKWTAYFNPDIPIHDGPYKFSGLPGLIVQIEDDTKSWKFSLFELNKADLAPFDSNFLFPAIKTKKEKYLKDKRYYLDNLVAIEESAGLLVLSDIEEREAQVKHREKMSKRNNNWIELYP